MNYTISRCVRSHLNSVIDNIVIYSECGDVLEIRHYVEADGPLQPRCHMGFYDTSVRVGIVTINNYRHIAEIYYDDPDMLSILKNLVCGILGLECVI